MHFSNAAALLAFSTISVYAAPFANPQDEFDRRQIAYQVVNVDGDSNGSAVPEIETVTKTATVAGASAAPQTVTVTATPSLTPYSSLPSSSAISHLAPPPGGSFMPAKSNGFFRRGLNAAGNPVQFAQNYVPSSSSAWPNAHASLAVRHADGWYAPSYTPSFTPSATPSASPLVARQFGSWVPSAPVPSSSSVVPTPSPSGSLVARQFGHWSSSSVPTPSTSPSVSPSAHVYARGYGAAPWGTPSYTPSTFPSFTASPTPLASLVAPRQFGDWTASAPVPSSSSVVPTPSPSGSLVARQLGGWSSSSVLALSSTPVAPTSLPVKRNFDSHFTPSSAATPTPSASFSIPRSSALLY